MKRRWIQAVVYAFAAFALWGYFDALSGMEPMTPIAAAHYLPRIHAAEFGAILLVAACVLSFFSPRYGAVCGLVGCISAGPCFATLLYKIPWSHFFEILRSFKVLPGNIWVDVYASTFAWVISSTYSITRVWLLYRNPASRRID